jgi:hypothetical protein
MVPAYFGESKMASDSVYTLEYVLEKLGFPMKHLDWSEAPPDPDLESMDPAVRQALKEQEIVDYYVDVLEGHVDTIMSNPNVQKAIDNVMKKKI